MAYTYYNWDYMRQKFDFNSDDFQRKWCLKFDRFNSGLFPIPEGPEREEARMAFMEKQVSKFWSICNAIWGGGSF